MRRSLWGTRVGKECGGQGTPAFSGAEGEHGGAHTLSFQEAVSRMPLCAPREGENAEWRFPAPLPPQDNPGIFPVPLAEVLRLAAEFPPCIIWSPLKLLPLLWFPG